MDKTLHLALGTAALLLLTTNAQAAEQQWQALTFGQSTDLNFGSTILPNKVGTNQVTHNGKQVTKPGPLLNKFTIESRGGKLANSHEGGTFYYTVLPTSENFTLSADVSLEQLGPETGATPNRQEGAALMVRDILGTPRATPQPLGHEEFPSASNMVMNLMRAHAKKVSDGMTNIDASYRRGVHHPWGSPHNLLKRKDYVKGIHYGPKQNYHMTLTRTDTNFTVSFQEPGGKAQTYTIDTPANSVAIQDKQHQYVGFFAARNAKVTVTNAHLTTTAAHTQQVPAYEPPATKLLVELASADTTAVHEYQVQAVANYAGTYTVKQDGKALGDAHVVKAGELLSVPATVNKDSKFTLEFTQQGSTNTQTKSWKVNYQALDNPYDLYVSPKGSAGNKGSSASPLDLETALALLAPGGRIHLLAGDYPSVTLSKALSGTPDKPKQMIGEGHVRFTGTVNLQANYWKLLNFEVAGARLIVNGSYNWIDKATVHGAPDTGIQVTSKRGIGRALWASHNLITNSESYNNMDKSQINADGFAVKMRVGDGNTLVNCISHHNVDDGYDLFNKVEDGPNGAVKIINSIAFANGQTFTMQNMKGGSRGNGFKLGGEGLPVPHTLVHCLSFNNHMDGITDNFNPGALTLMDNISIDNERFNYIVRQNPYGALLQPAYLSANTSLRLDSKKHYDDTVHGDVASDNHFFSAAGNQKQANLSKTELNNLKQVLDAPVKNEQQAQSKIAKLKQLFTSLKIH